VLLNLPRQYDTSDRERDAIRAAVIERLNQSANTRFASDARDAAYVLQVNAGRVVMGAVDGRDGRPVHLRLRPTGEAVEYEAVGRGLPLEDVVASVMSGFDDAWQIIEQQRSLDASNDARVIASLDHPDARMRDFVIRRLGERRSRAAVTALCERLVREPREELVLRAVGALVAIGDQRAVDSLIDLTRRKSPELVIQVVFALASLGGPTAEGYLVTLASGHPHPAVQKSAEDALTELHDKIGSRGAD
jgi:hypothetical protein